MFDNIGRKIKILAIVVCSMGIVASGVAGGMISAQGSVIGMVVVGLGVPGFLVVGVLLYGFGQLIENTDRLVEANIQSSDSFPKEKTMHCRTYNTDLPIRNIDLRLSSNGEVYMNFLLTRDIKLEAIRTEISIETVFGEKVDIGQVDFSSIIRSDTLLCETEYVYRPEIKEIFLKAKSASVHIAQYIEDGQLSKVKANDVEIALTEVELEELQSLYGKDAVVYYQESRVRWTCVCGKVNKNVDKFCVSCTRARELFKEKEIDVQDLYEDILEYASRDGVKSIRDIYEYAHGISTGIIHKDLQSLVATIKRLSDEAQHSWVPKQMVVDEIQSYRTTS